MNSELVAGNRLTLLNSGAAYFPALLAAINHAQKEIHLETYIFADDPTGHAVAQALAVAARRGVRVHVVVDGFGARNFNHELRPILEEAGAEVLYYRPELTLWNFKRHRLRRMHRKLVVIDARTAFIGGINIHDDNNTPEGLSPRYDYAVLAEGPIVAAIVQACRRMWEIVAWANFKRRLRIRHAPPAVNPPCGGQSAALLVRDNIRHRNDILNAYLDGIRHAREEVLIANAYFFPGIRFRRALAAAARRGVKVTLLLQGKTDHPLLRYATRALYRQALQSGIRVFEYHRSFMHAKVAVIDDDWATVGSSNIDPFSLVLAKESNLLVRDSTFAGELRASLLDALHHGAQEIRISDDSSHPWYQRPLPWLAYMLVRILAGFAGIDPARPTQAASRAPAE